MPANRPTRRGALSLELLILAPFILALLFVVIQFGMLLANQNLVESASAQAVRVAARGGDADDISDVAARVLGPYRFDRADVFVTAANPDGSPLRTGDPVEVRIEILARDVVPNLLVFIGFGLGDRKLTGRAVVMME